MILFSDRWRFGNYKAGLMLRCCWVNVGHSVENARVTGVKSGVGDAVGYDAWLWIYILWYVFFIYFFFFNLCI